MVGVTCCSGRGCFRCEEDGSGPECPGYPAPVHAPEDQRSQHEGTGKVSVHVSYTQEMKLVLNQLQL